VEKNIALPWLEINGAGKRRDVHGWASAVCAKV
jgi:hypothetical protein